MPQPLWTDVATARLARQALADPGARWLDLDGAALAEATVPAGQPLRLAAPLHLLAVLPQGDWRLGAVAARGGPCLLPVGTALAGQAAAAGALLLLALSPGRLGRAAGRLGRPMPRLLPLAGLADPCLAALLGALRAALASGPGAEPAAEAAVTAIAFRLVERHAPPAAPAGLSPEQLRGLEGFAAARLGERLGAAELAGCLGLPAGDFAALLRRSTGLGPAAWLRARRCDAARRLLAEGAMPIAEVALACGFGSQSRLGVAFRSTYGTTPAAWRRAAG